MPLVDRVTWITHVPIRLETRDTVRRVIVHSVKKVMPNYLTPFSTQEASLMVSRLLAWLTVIEVPTGLRRDNATCIRMKFCSFTEKIWLFNRYIIAYVFCYVYLNGPPFCCVISFITKISISLATLVTN